MGALGILGALAGGYVQAGNADRQRQFEADQRQRDAQLALSQMILQNPAVPPEYKGIFTQHAIDVVNTPYGKKLPSFDKAMQQAIQQPIGTPSKTQSVAQPPTTLTPPVPPPNATGGGVAGLPAGVVPVGVPPMVLPGGNATATQAASPYYSPGGTFHMMSPEEIMSRQLDAEAAMRQQHPELFVKPPEPFTLSPGETRFGPTGQPLATNTAPPPAMRAKEMYSVDAGPNGEIRGIIDNTGARPVHLSPEQAAQIPEAAQLMKDAQAAIDSRDKKIEAKETRMFSRQLAVQTQAMVNAIQTGAVNDAKSAAAKAREAYMKVNDTLQQDESRYNIMQKAYQDSLANPKNVGSFDAALLAFHMGMTVGAVKGMRQGRDLIMMHKQARSLPEGMQVAAEHWVNGAELSPEQRANFLKLAQDKMETSRMQANEASTQYQTAFEEYRSFVKDVSKGKVKMPAKGPGVTTSSPEDEANEYLNSLGKH